MCLFQILLITCCLIYNYLLQDIFKTLFLQNENLKNMLELKTIKNQSITVLVLSLSVNFMTSYWKIAFKVKLVCTVSSVYCFNHSFFLLKTGSYINFEKSKKKKIIFSFKKLILFFLYIIVDITRATNVDFFRKLW